jgi:hypothetical protein
VDGRFEQDVRIGKWEIEDRNIHLEDSRGSVPTNAKIYEAIYQRAADRSYVQI